MVAFYIGFGILIALLLILSTRIKINFKKQKSFTLTIYFLFFRYTYKKRKQKKRSTTQKATYRRIYQTVVGIIEKSEVTVESIILPKSSGFNAATTPLPYGYYSLISSLLAYVGEKAKRLTVKAGAIILFPAEPVPLSFDVTVSAPLYSIICSLLPLLFDLLRAKKQQKRVKNV